MKEQTIRQAARDILTENKGVMINDKQVNTLADLIIGRAEFLKTKEEKPMNTERFIVRQLIELSVRLGKIVYYNMQHNFIGSKGDAIEYAKNHNFGGGVECFDDDKNSYERLA